MPCITFFCDHPVRRVKTGYFKRKLEQVLIREGATTSVLNVVLTHNRAVRSLNRRFRKKDKPTDVLSFPYHDTDLLGEIYVSLDKTASQAREYGATFNDELWRLLLHGALHLLGHDHHKPGERLRMERKEALYLNPTGLPTLST